jgi:hypothetical protein
MTNRRTPAHLSRRAKPPPKRLSIARRKRAPTSVTEISLAGSRYGNGFLIAADLGLPIDIHAFGGI